MNSIYMHGLDMLGAQDFVAGFDLGIERKKMDGLKVVTVGIAHILLQGGQKAIDEAIKNAKQPWYREPAALVVGPFAATTLPGETRRNEVYWKLKWHADNLAKYAGRPNELYPNADDLKKWVLEAFVEQNAVEEGSDQSAQLWGKAMSDYAIMWADVGRAIAAIPVAVVKKLTDVVDTAQTAAKWTLGIGLGVVALLGYAMFKVVTSDTGKQVAGTVATHYLTGGMR